MERLWMIYVAGRYGDKQITYPSKDIARQRANQERARLLKLGAKNRVYILEAIDEVSPEGPNA